MVLEMLEAKRNIGHHFVAMRISPGFFPAFCKAFDNAFSDAPLPYISAVSNQLMPPSRERDTTFSIRPSSSIGQYLPAILFCLLNCQDPSPIGVTYILVCPRKRELSIFIFDIIIIEIIKPFFFIGFVSFAFLFR